jgi:hypothetical protein
MTKILTAGAPRIGVAGATRIVEYELIADAEALEIGAFVLGSMRLERNLQSQRGHLAAFEAAVAGQPELLERIARLKRLPPGDRQRHLDLLRAGRTAELRSRLQPLLLFAVQPTQHWHSHDVKRADGTKGGCAARHQRHPLPCRRTTWPAHLSRLARGSARGASL